MKLAAVAFFAAVTALSVSPCAAASGEEARTPIRQLLYNGQPLTRLLYPVDVSPNTFPAAGPQEPGGQITGVALDAIGKPLANHDVTLRLTGQLEVIGTTTTDATGRFAFSALNRGQYFVEVVIGMQVVAAGGPIRVTEGGMTFAQVGGPRVSPTRHRKGVLYWTAVGAGVGGGIGLLTMFRDECRYPESLCPLAPIFFGMTGAFMGFFVGLGN